MSLEQDLLKQRLQRIQEIEALGFRAYGQRFESTHTIPQIRAGYGAKTAEELAPQSTCASPAAFRPSGAWERPAFSTLQQLGEKLQIYVKKDALSETDYALYQFLDLGDIIGAEGYLFRTRPANSAYTWRSSTSWRRPCWPCPKSGTAWKMWRPVTASAIWT